MCPTHPIVPNKYRGTSDYNEVLQRLIQAAREHQLIYYEEDVATIMGLKGKGNHMANETGHLLGEISEDEHNQGRPMLSSIVVHKAGKDKGIPGNGFFNLAVSLGKLSANATDQERQAFWQNERDAIYREWAQ
jgi:hypothetical protein